ncbi:cytochrome c oxidase assembly factor 3, mitochondrial [Copidosoma floridanum]|uniref:cytochrome c oxidase assembly factor 3, mitochondrial n=1 Tax=Copidosoma floridanum TaxID=29053 RepID=UPI0006C98EE3|nr:cytochrome c oxidase assembly factor 3, mitochondrial [Copidosoma floridanum]XP_023247232.1 cytochrome c oxidase assembly factor 3, mitochondrial [Copidosoma floridanum]
MDYGDRVSKLSNRCSERQLNVIEKEYIQRVQQQNWDRVKKWSRIRYKNRYLGTALGVGVFSIYLYSMWAIKQESFLDDFNEPEKVIEYY